MTLSDLRKYIYGFCIASLIGLLVYVTVVHFSSIEVNRHIIQWLGLGALVPFGVFKTFELSVGGYEEDK